MNYKIIEDNYISVCAWCFPGETILAACPELRRDVQISHGVCPACAAAFRADLKKTAASLKADDGPVVVP